MKGTVASVNAKGFKIAGSQDWCDYSQYFEGEEPEVGDLVEYTLQQSRNGRAYVQTCKVVEYSDNNDRSEKVRPSTFQTRKFALEQAVALNAPASVRSFVPVEDITVTADKFIDWLEGRNAEG